MVIPVRERSFAAQAIGPKPDSFEKKVQADRDITSQFSCGDTHQVYTSFHPAMKLIFFEKSKRAAAPNAN